MFHQQVFANQNLYRTQFHSLKQGSKSISEFCDEAKNLFDSLQSIGDPITEESLVLQVLNGLCGDYRMFVTNIENCDQKPSFSQLRAKLLTHESRLKQTESNFNTSVPISAMATMNLHTLPHESSNKTTVVCQICEKPGHKASFCYHRFSGNSGSTFGRSGGRYTNQAGVGRGYYPQWQNDGGQRGFSANYAGYVGGQLDSRVSDVSGAGQVRGFDQRIFGSDVGGQVHILGPNVTHQPGVLGPSPNTFQHSSGFTQASVQNNSGLNNFG
ncbi:putative transcription factor interactor and regulator CCHC(Zn) family [Helianthus annuus]|nr:putative transcription factor interactor and regulator CCHC(Zn) family [Helianthus annuus]KAJ0447653.1 putative transcription factor interactor and regulator CCHC(Zn) family [Helianthus annuus]KAJ0632556.1 putative transcription factor interactor and regulator CCHC(Zn) family [Helianthus annuus]KAJ0826451.1 putative transcription factor interactor and regulator CCHC(Zn) family [Helianthus annuus]